MDTTIKIILAFLPLVLSIGLSYLAYITSELVGQEKKDKYSRAYILLFTPLMYLLFYLDFGKI